MSKLVTYELDESIATITMDDGKVNVMSLAMLSALNRALDRAQADKAIVIMTGRAGVFSAGFDLPVLTAGGMDAQTMMRSGFELSERLLSFPAPVVIACTGHALAMGIFLVLAADYRVGAEGPFKLGANEVAIGLTMPHFAIEICRQRLVPAHFNRALITAEIYSPGEAVAAGFLDQVVPAADLQTMVREKAKQLTQLDRAAHAATKLRVRDHAIKAVRASIERDDAMYRARAS